LLLFSLLTVIGIGPSPKLQAAPQGNGQPPAGTGPGATVTLRGNTRAEARAGNDRGRVSDDLPLAHMMLQLQRTSDQEQALEQLIKDLHDPSSPLFHQWLTAPQFGQKYGASQSSINQVTAWLESQGFEVNFVYPN
jgi:hypothetical protein